MSRRIKALIGLLLIAFSAFMVFRSVNYDFSEFRISMKAIFRQELTLEEMKASSIFRAYNHINHDTYVEEIDKLLNMKSKNIMEVFESWNYPYGYVSVWYNRDKEPRVSTKVVSFKTPYTVELTEEKLAAIFMSGSYEEAAAILGEPAMLGESYDRSGRVTDFYCNWGIKTSLSEEFIKDIEKKYGGYISFPLSYSHPANLWKKRSRKLRLHMSLKADDTIEKFSLDEY